MCKTLNLYTTRALFHLREATTKYGKMDDAMRRATGWMKGTDRESLDTSFSGAKRIQPRGLSERMENLRR